MTDMQPGVSPVPGGVEQLPPSSAQNAGAPERMPMLPAPEVRPETGIETGVERREQAAELQAAQADASAAAAQVVAIPEPTATPVQPSTTPIITDAPLTAANDDVIEKEWVDKAKQIISITKDDPYKRGQQVGELQRDYMKKRYGKDVGASPAA